MKSRPLLAAVLLGSWLSACSTMQVQTAKDPQADFSKYRTYSWMPEPAGAGQQAQASILDQTVKSTAEQALAKKGLEPAPAGTSPDLLITYSAKARNEIQYGA